MTPVVLKVKYILCHKRKRANTERQTNGLVRDFLEEITL